MMNGRDWKNGVQVGEISHNLKWFMFVKGFVHCTNQKLVCKKTDTKME